MYNYSKIKERFKEGLLKIVMDLFAVIFAAFGWYFGVVRYNNEAAQRSVLQDLVVRNKRTEEKMRKTIDSLVGIDRAKVKIINGLISSGISNRSDWDNFELPLWEKELIADQWVITFVNQAYVEDFLYGQNRYDLIGNTGYLVYPEKLPKVYQKNDWAAWKSKSAEIYIEPYLRIDGSLGKMESLKFRRWRLNGKKVIMGIALRKLN